jgi:hypothetical protein
VEQFANGVVHPITKETITQYHKVKDNPTIGEVWQTGMRKEFERMAQGDKKTGTVGTHAIFVMTHDEFDSIPEDIVVTYARIVIDLIPQKEDPNRVRITAGGNLIKTRGYLTTRIPDLTTFKILGNSIFSTEGAKCAGFDISNFYL